MILHWAGAITGNRLANCATSGAEHSFAHGLRESLVQCAAEQQPVLFLAYDTAAVDALTHTVASEGVLAAALLIAPRSGPQSGAQLPWHLAPGGAAQPQPNSPAAQRIAHNAMATALSLFEAFALARPVRLAWPLSRHQLLQLEIGA